jgi:hypothetical protein
MVFLLVSCQKAWKIAYFYPLSPLLLKGEPYCRLFYTKGRIFVSKKQIITAYSSVPANIASDEVKSPFRIFPSE